MWVTMAGNCRSFISCYFEQFLNKLNLKNTIRYIRIHIQCTGKSKIDQTCSFLHILFDLFQNYKKCKSIIYYKKRKTTPKIFFLVCHSHDFLFPCLTTEENLLWALHPYISFIIYAWQLNELSVFYLLSVMFTFIPIFCSNPATDNWFYK